MLGGELHYQAMVYHCLRQAGVPRGQLGMNVKQHISAPVSNLFRELDLRKHEDFRGGFEPIPDVVIFSPEIDGDWQRRNNTATLRHMLLAIEVKASERENGRLGSKEVIRDIEKLAAHREEALHRGSMFAPVVLVVDTAPKPSERMRPRALEESRRAAAEHGVTLFYLSPCSTFADVANLATRVGSQAAFELTPTGFSTSAGEQSWSHPETDVT